MMILPNLKVYIDLGLTSTRLHTRALKMVKNAYAPLLQRGDRAGTRFCFDDPVVLDRDLWSSSTWLLRPEGPTWFTDGSVTPTGSGARIVGPRFNQAIPLGKDCSIVQAELVCALENIRRVSSGEHIYI